MKIKISKSWLTKKFPCSEGYILNTCKGRCCQGSGDKILVSLLPEEEKTQKEMGYDIEGGKLKPFNNFCPHKNLNGLCRLHNTPQKPFGCILSPFTINKNNTLVIRYRYSRLKCFNKGIEAYKVFRNSLVQLFGENQTTEIIEKIEKDDNNIYAEIKEDTLQKVFYLDGLKK